MTLASVLLVLASYCSLLPANARSAVAREVLRSELPPGVVLAVMYAESRGSPRACANNRFGAARGLMQIEVVGDHCSKSVTNNLYNPVVNVRRGIAILKMLYAKSHDWSMALFHYSGGSWRYSRRVLGIAKEMEERDELR
jgi:soluble lytic murein transglycosylase-like protein